MTRTLIIGTVVWGGVVNAEVITYDGSVYPETVGWERVGSEDADRWIDDGWFCHFLELGVWEPGPLGEADFYKRSLGSFAGVGTFFMEWQVETDAPSSILDSSGVPVVVSAGGRSAAFYHTTITDSRVQLFRDTDIPLVFVDIEPGVPHSYRLELHGAESYAWYIDGELVDYGVPEGPYPTESSVLNWGAQHHTFDTNCRWDYVNYGVIPEPATVLLFLPGAASLAWWRRPGGG
jgi:hypothetical protein